MKGESTRTGKRATGYESTKEIERAKTIESTTTRE